MRKSFECKEEYVSGLQALKDFTSGKGSGYLLTYTDVERLIGFAKGSREFDYMLRVRFIKDMLKNRGIVLQAVNGVGYRFMLPDEVVDDRVPLRVRKSRNQLRRGEKEIATVTADLNKIKNTAKRRLAISAQEYLIEKRKEINRALRQLKKTETLPTRKPI